jgi:hypothetical protein
MRTIQIDPSGSSIFSFQIDSGEIRSFGDERLQEITAEYGYFVNEDEVLNDDAMVPEILMRDERIVLRQTSDQVHRAKRMGAKMRLTLSTPAILALECRLETGHFDVQSTAGCTVGMASGVANITGITGAVKVVIRAGTLCASGLRRGYTHSLSVDVGTLTLHAGELMRLVGAIVEQGTIQGSYVGRLERKSVSGWVLYPAESDPKTSIECSVGSGTITIR